MKTLCIISSVFFIVAMYGADKTEERLADSLAKANRAAAHANEKAQAAGSKLDIYCQGKRERAGINEVSGLWGCVVFKPQPLPPPGTNR